MELALAKLIGLLLGASFAALLLWLPRRTSAPLVERERDGEGDYIFQVTPDAVTRGAWPVKNLIDKD